MIKTEILEKLLVLKEAEDVKSIGKELKTLSATFHRTYNKEQREREEAQLDLEKEVVIDPEQEKLDKEINDLIDFLHQRIADFKKQQAEEEKENFAKKEVILRRFQLLMQNEENLGVLFNNIKEIREEWNAVGHVPKAKHHDIQKQYSQLNELFNYNVNIYKELKENDLKKNYSLKNQLIHKVKELLEENNLRKLDKEVKKLQNEWEGIGPTFTEHWEKLKEEYWSTVKAIYEKIGKLREEVDAQRQENLEKKTALIEKVKELVAEIPSAHSAWEKTTKSLKTLQEEWKKVGFAPKEVNDKIWEEFRSYYDKFYEAKSAFYEKAKEGNEEKRKLKEAIIEKATQLKEITDWKAGVNLAVSLQREWKSIGHAGQHAEQRLWKAFRAKCDEFFDRKDKHYADLDAANEGNLKEKETLIAEIKAYKGSGDSKKDIEALKSFSSRFAAIGNVPFKKKDEVYKSYKEALDAQYDGLKLSGREREKVFFQAKMDAIKGAADPMRIIQNEKNAIRKKINDITKEIANFENNLGFFNVSKGSEGLLSGITSKIKKGKDDIDALKNKLRSLTKMEKESQKPKEDKEPTDV